MIAIKENNKVFELIDFLHSKKDDIITGHYKVARIFFEKNELAYSLKPKHALEDDTAYNEALKEKENALSQYDKVLKTYKDKLNELNFKTPYSIFDLIHYRSEFKDIFDEWENENAKNGSKKKAIEKLKECRSKFNDLQDEKIIYFLKKSLPSFFFYDLSEILKERFDKYIQPKYSGLSKELQPYLDGANDEVIESIIDEHKLPQGANKPEWKSKADGARFGKYVGLENRQLRELFNNDIRTNNIPPDANRNNEIRNILLRNKVPQAKQE